MTIKDLKEQGLIVLECLSGSRAYGLHHEGSDWDIKGVFVLPREQYYGWEYVGQVSDERNDKVYYELGRFLELLSVNNPNIMELLYTREEAVIYKNPLIDSLPKDLVLSKLAEKSFGKFAESQIKKARGLNKKILNPMGAERKTVLDFCYVNHQQGSLPLVEYLEQKGWKASECGLVKLPNMRELYGVYRGSGLRGLISSEASNELLLSTVKKGASPEGYLHFNKDGYSKYCKDYKAYWDWVAKRNEERYANTLKHSKNYDAKNMMHTFRLLKMAIEIAVEQEVRVWREDRDFLLSIKVGDYDYEELLALSEDLQIEMYQAFEQSTLPERPNKAALMEHCARLRSAFYAQGIGI